MDTAGNCIFLNDAAKRILPVDVSDNAALGEQLLSLPLTYPDGRPAERAENPFVLALNGQAVFDRIFQLYRGDSKTSLSITSQPVFSGEGHLIGINAYLRELAPQSGPPASITAAGHPVELLDDQLAICGLAVVESENHLFMALQKSGTGLAETGLPDDAVPENYLSEVGPGYHSIAELVPFGVWIANPAGKTIWVSQHLLDTMGITREEFLKNGLFSYLPREEQEAARSSWRQSVESGTIWDFKFHVKSSSGENLTIVSRGMPVRDAHGEVLYWVGVNLDITPRERAEESERQYAEMAASFQQIQSVFANMTDGLIIFDHSGRVLSANPAALCMHGIEDIPDYSFGLYELQQYFVMKTLDGQDLPFEEWPVSRVLQGEEFSNLELILDRPATGFSRILSYSGVAVHDTSGDDLFAILTSRDVTEVKETDKFREEYVSMISHDLRSPLAVITGRNDLLLRKLRSIGDEGMIKNAEATAEAAQRMNRMIQDIVDSARLEAGVFTIIPCPVSVPDLVKKTAQRDIPPSELARLKVFATKNLPQVMADPEQVERVLGNLLQNSLKYSEPGTPITISLISRGHEVIISIADQGAGITAAAIPHLFERYYRVGDKHRKTGSGLGLYISKMLVEAHSGRIWVESAEGRGSTFYFTLPAAAAREE